MGFIRDAWDDLRDGFLGELLIVVPVVVGAVVGFLVADVDGLIVGGLAGAALVAAYLLWTGVSWVREVVGRRRSG